MDINYSILDYCLKEYKETRERIATQFKTTDFHLDYELALSIFWMTYIDARQSPEEAKLLEFIKKYLNWTDVYYNLLQNKINKQPSYQFSDLKTASKDSQWAVILYKILFCVALIDDDYHTEENNLIQNFRANFFVTKPELAQEVETHFKGLAGPSVKNADQIEVSQAPAGNVKITPEVEEEEEPVSIDEAVSSLESLIGLEGVKKEIQQLTSFLKVQQMRKEHKLKDIPLSMHMVFTGNPGTGKTTVARIVANILKAMGILKKGHLIETDRSGLVGQYIGHTETKTNGIIDQALGGILFIDEAYSLYKKTENDFGQEAIDTLVKRLEDDRDNFVVIVAGYSAEMEEFLKANSGLRSRFNTFIDFADYNEEQLMDIFKLIMQKNDYTITEDAEALLLKKFDTDKSKEHFSNGRYVRNIFERLVRIQAVRLAAETSALAPEQLTSITESEIKSLED